MESEKIFKTLKSILQNYESKLDLVFDESDKFYLNSKKLDENNKPEFFASVQIKKSYVAFHLMPIYYNPELLNGISDDLRKRMQGKSCFNFTKFDDTLFKELDELTKICFERYQTLDKI